MRKGKVRLLTPGGTQEVNVVNEGGLYLLAFTSKKPKRPTPSVAGSRTTCFRR